MSLKILKKLTDELLYSHKKSSLGLMGGNAFLTSGDVTKTPLDVPGLQAWYDMSDINTVTKDGSDRVSRLDDKSPNNRDLVQITAAKQPLWLEASRNGLDVTQFISRLLEVNWPSISIPVDVFMVMKSEVPFFPNNGQVFDGRSSSEIRFVHGGGIQSDNLYQMFADSVNCISNRDVGVGSWAYFTMRYLGPGNDPSIRINGVDETLSENGSLGTSTGLTLGAKSTEDGQSDMQVGELIFYNETTSTDNRDFLESYLANKWGFI